MELISEDPSSTCAPPPHIAARFYRKSSVRRRTSASSSRRSSMSSIHSQHSNISAHGGPQSTHIAQHLRRASIIEDRKARLADRAAHAERVRLRAAIAKATPRTSTAREERALAAQVTREKLLADITAKCEEEVRRAKRIAEEIKEKKAAEHARLREEMTEKLADAERRRLLYQQTFRRPRTASLAVVEEKKVSKTVLKKPSRDAAARIIQRGWKSSQERSAINAFLALNLSIENVRAMSFEDVGELLSQESVIACTTKLLRTLRLQDATPGSDCEKGSIRIFLSAFLIVAHPEQVLSSGGKQDQEQDLISKAQDLLVDFEKLFIQLKASNYSVAAHSADIETLAVFHNIFVSAFHSWKTHDSTTLIEVMVAQFVELDLIWQTVKNDRAGGVADDYHEGIQRNQIELLAKLKRLAGHEKALSLVRTAVRRARKRQNRDNARTSADDHVPRAAPITESSTSASVPDPTSQQLTATPTFEDIDTTTAADFQRELFDRLSRAMTPIPSNREVSHEMLMTGKFELQQEPYTEVRKQFTEMLCTSMRQDVSNGAGIAWTLAMAQLVRDRLFKVVPASHPLHETIDQILDIQLIENQCKANLFSYDSFFDAIYRILPHICSVGRDAAVKEGAEDKSGDAIDRLMKLLGLIDLLSLDYTNYMFRLAAKTVIEHGYEYEQSFFDQTLKGGRTTLNSTRQSWHSARKTILEDLQKRDPENINPPPSPHPNKIYAQLLVDLVLSNDHMDLSLAPETLCLDHTRLLEHRAHALKIVATAAVLLTTKNHLRRDTQSAWKPDADRILTLDFTDVKPERVMSIIESSHPMPAATRTQVLGLINRVIPPAKAAARRTIPTTTTEKEDSNNDFFAEPVARLLLGRLRAHVLARLSVVSNAERLKATSTASAGLAGAGMPEFVGEVGVVVEGLGRIMEVDLRGHGVWYEEIAREGADV